MDLFTTDPNNYAIIVSLYTDFWELDDIEEAMSSTSLTAEISISVPLAFLAWS